MSQPIMCYLSKQTARLHAEPEYFVSRCSNQQVLSGGWREANLQGWIQTRALYIQNAHVYMKQLNRDGIGQCGHINKLDL